MNDVIDDASGHRLVLSGERGDDAELVYARDDSRMYLLHTEVPDVFRGQGVGSKLVSASLEVARRGRLTVVPWCPFARRWLRDHPSATDGVTIDWSTPPPGRR